MRAANFLLVTTVLSSMFIGTALVSAIVTGAVHMILPH